MSTIIILVAVLCLAFANGSNDNFKGVATLFGSGAASYRGALTWATGSTLLGSLTALFFAEKLLQNFSGRGLVLDELVTAPNYVAAVALGAGLTVLLASKIGLPISTTHSLVGALVGAGFAAGSSINIQKLAFDFFAPLLLSPLLAILATSVCYLLFRSLRNRIGINKETCFCVGTETIEQLPALSHAAALQHVEHLTVTIGSTVTCEERYRGKLLGFQASTILDKMHYLSAGIVSYARGLNDTPKIAALLLLVPQLSAQSGLAAVGIAIAVGGIIGARKVAELMSKDITPMNPGQGFTGNPITGFIVIGASRLGVPVSTTHVSCGALFGIGAVTGQAKWQTIATIVAAWVSTLPVAALLSALSYKIVCGLP